MNFPVKKQSKGSRVEGSVVCSGKGNCSDGKAHAGKSQMTDSLGSHRMNEYVLDHDDNGKP